LIDHGGSGRIRGAVVRDDVAAKISVAGAPTNIIAPMRDSGIAGRLRKLFN